MTARVIRPETICCAANCGRLGEYHIDARLWAKVDPRHERPPAQVETGLVVCGIHRDKPPSTCGEFFPDEARQDIRAHFAEMGAAEPDFDNSRWVFTPIETPPPEAAH